MLGITRKLMAAVSSAITITVVLVLALATTASAGSPIVHRVRAGSPDTCAAYGLPPGCNANFSLVATQRADGSVTGQLTDQFGRGVGGYHAIINCLSVEGKDAWVSGVIAQGTYYGEDLAGWPVVVRVRDNGTSANDSPDQISWSGIEPTCDQQPDFELFDVPQGQVVVE